MVKTEAATYDKGRLRIHPDIKKYIFNNIYPKLNLIPLKIIL
jgi:hypothetical protein